MLDYLKTKCENLSALTPTNLYINLDDGREAACYIRLEPPTFLARLVGAPFGKASGARHFRLPDAIIGKSAIRYTDHFGLSYLIWPVGFPHKQRYIVTLGPFKTKPLDNVELRHISHRMKLGSDNRAILESFYNIIPDYNQEALAKIAYVFCAFFESRLDQPEIMIEDHSAELPSSEEYIDGKFEEYGYVAHNITIETKLLDAVEHGDVEFIRSILKQNIHFFNMPPRFPDNPLREVKNLAITANSICMRAAVNGGLNPSVAHNMSHIYAIRIERQSDIKSMTKLLAEITLNFTQAVRNYALQGYSELIVNAINYIRRNLTSPLSLARLAEELHVSREHLCRRFSREMGTTLTDYIHKTKIQESFPMLASRRYRITDIALFFGYSSPSHYTKAFEKYMGVPPTEWDTTVPKF